MPDQFELKQDRNCRSRRTLASFSFFITFMVNINVVFNTHVGFCLQKDLEVPVPRYFLRDHDELLKDKRTVFNKFLETHGADCTVREEPARSRVSDHQTPEMNFSDVESSFLCFHQVSLVSSMNLEEAVRPLQVCEHAWQGRIRAQFMTELIQAERGVSRHTWKPSNLTPEQPAIQSQKVTDPH